MELEDERHAIILENVFYLLCGVDTTHLRIGVKDKRYALIGDPTYPPQLILPFESLAINVRVLNKFILKSQYSSDTIREMVGDYFEAKIGKYLKDLMGLRCQTRSIEMLIVSLGSRVEEFDEMKEIVDDIRDMSGVRILNHLKKRRDRTVHFLGLYDDLINPCIHRIREEVQGWVTEGLMPSSEFMVKKNECLNEFTDCVWTHWYRIAQDNVPYFLEDHKNLIYNCGRIVNLGRMIHGKNIFHNLAEEYGNLGLTGLNSYLNTQFLESLRSSLERELDVMYRYLLVNESSLYLDIFEELGDEMFFPNERTVAKMNAIRESKNAEGLIFRRSDVPTNKYILEILNTKMEACQERHLTMLQLLTVEYTPSILRNFLSPRTVSELEIIFRFLFTLTGLSYYMSRFKGFWFARMAAMVVDKFRFSIHSRMKPVRVEKDMDYIRDSMLSSTKKWLRDMYLTSGKAYHAWSNFFDLCFNFLDVEYKSALSKEEIKMFEGRLVGSIVLLKDVLEVTEHSDLFVHFLGSTQWIDIGGGSV